MNARDLTTADVADILGVARYKIYKLARKHGIGANMRGNAGYRFTPADVDRLRQAATPKPAPTKTRRVA